MTAHTLITGEGPRARTILDRLARRIGLGSGQILLATLESLDDKQEQAIANAMKPLLPTDPPAKVPADLKLTG
jgi:hypothetical protein